MDRKIKILVGSTVYGFENELYQIVALLRFMGYYQEVIKTQLELFYQAGKRCQITPTGKTFKK